MPAPRDQEGTSHPSQHLRLPNARAGGQQRLKTTAEPLQRGARGRGNITTALNTLQTPLQAAELAGCPAQDMMATAAGFGSMLFDDMRGRAT